MAVDILIANPFSKVGGANPKPLAAALSREVDKMNKYAADCSRLNPQLPPTCSGCIWWYPTQHSALCPKSPHQQGQELCAT